jgi:hypothetical protein
MVQLRSFIHPLIPAELTSNSYPDLDGKAVSPYGKLNAHRQFLYIKHGIKQCKIPLINYNSHSSFSHSKASVPLRIHPSIPSILSRALNGRYQFPLSTLLLWAVWLALSPFFLPSPLPLPPPASHFPLKSHITHSSCRQGGARYVLASCRGVW